MRHHIKWLDTSRTGGLMHDAFNEYGGKIFLGLTTAFVGWMLSGILAAIFGVLDENWIVWGMLAVPIMAEIFIFTAPRLHINWGLNRDQRDAIGHLNNTSKAGKTLFPVGFEKTVRNNPDKATELHRAAFELFSADQARQRIYVEEKSIDPKVSAALTILRENAQNLKEDNLEERMLRDRVRKEFD